MKIAGGVKIALMIEVGKLAGLSKVRNCDRIKYAPQMKCLSN
jgi:hypothetical protein